MKTIKKKENRPNIKSTNKSKKDLRRTCKKEIDKFKNKPRIKKKK